MLDNPAFEIYAARVVSSSNRLYRSIAPMLVKFFTSARACNVGNRPRIRLSVKLSGPRKMMNSFSRGFLCLVRLGQRESWPSDGLHVHATSYLVKNVARICGRA